MQGIISKYTVYSILFCTSSIIIGSMVLMTCCFLPHYTLLQNITILVYVCFITSLYDVTKSIDTSLILLPK